MLNIQYSCLYSGCARADKQSTPSGLSAWQHRCTNLSSEYPFHHWKVCSSVEYVKSKRVNQCTRRVNCKQLWCTERVSAFLPSKLLKDSKSSVSDWVESCSWYLEATWTQIWRFCLMLAESMALRHSRESSTDRAPKKFTSHCNQSTTYYHISQSRSTMFSQNTDGHDTTMNI